MTRKMVIFGFIGVLIVLGFFIFSNRKELKQRTRNEDIPLFTPTPASVSPDATPTATPYLPAGAEKLSPKDMRKIIVLENVMKERRESDPRVEIDLMNLSPAVKTVMEKLYNETPREQAAERAQIVMVIGRQVTQKSDVDFLKNVLMEKPPLDAKGRRLQESAEAVANAPQTMAIQKLVEQDRLLRGDPNADKSLAPYILEALRQSLHSPNPKVASDSAGAIFYLTGKK